MDRCYRAFDTVYVYQSSKADPPLDKFRQQPYQHAGFDNYLYEGKMYFGYVDLDRKEAHAYILLDKPVFDGRNHANV